MPAHLTYPPSVLACFETAFGAPWRRGPIPTGLDVLERDLRRQGAWQSPRLPPPALSGATEVPLIWTRDLLPDELGCRWVVSVDKHGAYLGVLSSLELGVGHPRRDDRPEANPRLPGYWRVRCSYPPAPELWPDALGRPRRGASSYWITTPTLELALEHELEVEVLESWTWPVHRRLLRPFGERCTTARQTLTQRAEAPSGDPDALGALRVLKHTYGPILGGFLARSRDRRLDRPPPWYRPDWRHAVIAKARSNLLRNLASWRTRGGLPIGVYNDGVAFASNELPDELAARLGIRLDSSLGGYSTGRLRPLSQVVQHGRLSFPALFRP